MPEARSILKKGLLALAAACVCAGGAAASEPGPGLPQAPARRASLRFASGRRIRADVVDTDATREKGLMFRKSLPKGYGMLFAFPVETDLGFWMKNTWVSLDIVFIGKDKRVTRVHERVPASTQETTDRDVARVRGPGQYVLELPAGAARRYGLKEGQTVSFTVPGL